MTNNLEEKLYAERDNESDELRELFMLHMDHMTTENLYSKADIASELAWRDRQINTLKTLLKTHLPRSDDPLQELNHVC